MRKRWVLVGMVFLLLPWLTVGCGIAEEEYAAVVSDLNKAEQELQVVKAELEASQAKVSGLTASLEESETELKATKAKNSELTSSLGKNQTELEAAQAKVSELTASLEESESELTTTKSEYSSFKSEAKRLILLLDNALKLNHAILGTNAEILTDDLDGVRKGCLTITAILADLKDLKKAEFQALWEEAYVVEGAQWNLYFDPFERFMALHASRISDKAKWLIEHLTK